MADAVTSDLNRHLSQLDAEEQLERSIEHFIQEYYDYFHQRLVTEGQTIIVTGKTWEVPQFLTFLDTEGFNPRQGLLHLASRQFVADCRNDPEIGISAWDVNKHIQRKGY